MMLLPVHDTLPNLAYPIRQCMEHDTLPNLAGVVPVHPLYVVVAHKIKMEVSPDAAQTSARLALDDATKHSRNT